MITKKDVFQTVENLYEKKDSCELREIALIQAFQIMLQNVTEMSVEERDLLAHKVADFLYD
jgi:hypothetical protein